MQQHMRSSFHEMELGGVLKHQSFMLFNLTGKMWGAEVLWESRLEGLSLWAIHTLCCVKRFCQGYPLALFMVLIDRISGWVQLVEGVTFGSWLQYAVPAFYSWRGPIDLIKHWPSVHLVAVCSHVKVARVSLADGIRSLAIWEALRAQLLLLFSWGRSSIWSRERGSGHPRDRPRTVRRPCVCHLSHKHLGDLTKELKRHQKHCSMHQRNYLTVMEVSVLPLHLLIVIFFVLICVKFLP